ncbi:MAG: O-antigen ligase family protein [Bacteroidetes bacterium]|nr:O-antigen ligase family protein [Bacteroidota bacterium]
MTVIQNIKSEFSDLFLEESWSSRTFLAGAFALLIGVFTSNALMTISVVLVGFSYLIRTIESKKFLWPKPLHWVGILLYVLMATSYLWAEPNQEEYMHNLRIKASWLIVTVGFIGLQPKKKWLMPLLWIFAISAFITAALSVGNYFMHYEEMNEMIKHSKPIPIINGFWHIPFSYLLAFSILSAGYLAVQKKGVYRTLLILLAAFNFIFIHILTARTGLVALYAAGLFLLAWSVFKKGYWKHGIIGGIGIALAVILAVAYIPSLNNRYDNTVKDLKHVLAGGNANYHSGGMRVKAIQAGWLVFTENPVSGVGMGNLRSAIIQAYDDLDAKLLPENQINPHNQFLNFMVITGTLGLVLFVLFWAIPFLRFKKLSLLFVLFVVLSFVAMNFEALLERQIGVSFFPFMFLLLSSNSISSE